MTDFKVTLENVGNLTKEDLINISKNCWSAYKVIDLTKLKDAQKALSKEQDNIEGIAFAIKDRAIELGVGPASEGDIEDLEYELEEDEEVENADLRYRLYEFMQDVASQVDQKYGYGEYGEGSEDCFWVPSTC